MKLASIDWIVSTVVSHGLRAFGCKLSIPEAAAALCRVARDSMIAAGYSTDQTEGLFDRVVCGNDIEVAEYVAGLIGGHVAIVIVPPAERSLPMLAPPHV